MCARNRCLADSQCVSCACVGCRKARKCNQRNGMVSLGAGAGVQCARGCLCEDLCVAHRQMYR